MSISLSDAAAERIKSHLAQRGGGLGLRLGIKRTGCSGWSYVLDLADEAGADDVTFQDRGVTVVVDRDSLPLVDGTRLDFVREGLSEMFRFENPNASGECGCGESFSADPES
jgi:iron-sulfur cluster assembly protein